MMDSKPIVAFLKRTYPNPEVDPGWVQECAKALIDAGGEVSIESMHAQFLYSDLSQSTLPSRSFPVQDELHDIFLFPRPHILQIQHISEIGHSAFQIQHTMEQRSEVLSGQNLIRRMDDEEEGENELDNGKVPPYPRSMLKLELSDGRRVVKAMEYRRIGGLVLGQTSLGCKVVCRNVRCLRDTLLLTPENTQVIESSVDHLEAIQKEEFLNDLQRRMGKLEGHNGSAPKRKIKPPPAVRPKPNLTAISSRPLNPPKRSQPQAQAQVLPPSPDIVPTAGPSRSRYFPPPTAQGDMPLFDPPSSPQIAKPKPVRAKGVKRRPSIEEIEVATTSISSKTPRQRNSRAAAKAATAKVQQLYHDIPNDKLTELDYVDDEDDFGYDVDESFIRQVDEVTAQASGSGSDPRTKEQEVHNFDDEEEEEEDCFMMLDDSMIRQIDKLSNSHQDDNKGKGKQPPFSTKKRYYDPDEDADEDVGAITIDDEDGFHVDENFLRHLDAMEYDRQQGLSSQTHGRSSQSTAPKRGRTNGVLSRNGRGSNKRESRSSSLEDSQKENYEPEIIEISD
ncbi:hypothetical protein I302_107569 [Kwoniella bestiolae CBS 10118]|uniref:RecQ-mediated genome instability protein 1 n=1 Tax=Kwoniella bestiolae CBS 10118 TaxID=1296100 RepID=A0A1B9FY54_9TREE|nr:hypothetical protein I302_06691 [Kwoniella bestiolae CBS 10118]OCF23708.1 hypothetical protein I302_06691 [Kwoniella bestiolae CBS 10118]